ncbi:MULTISPECIES: hypothetical protein [Azospirillum]|uniref:Uncharacterized protein n=1 Tax=Azospirillum brasilense TaxID=192 RepID=A0ABU4P2L3_AZOBR|nr:MULTISPECIES: hypothetical protein [Azospirillum]MDW7555491.1 hypothetical protein [Azospirillum brasilense]MDW7595101.1 hypothetical protein [Azospirillum brasilense]MDW7630254.1 hypothetical protein [Azospirillum brasilense]MDX5949622.1 hypothetical protein [Azospirillum brasilense]TVZ67514.1 hypothetical protein OH82_00654 [Azospirillum brasilense]
MVEPGLEERRELRYAPATYNLAMTCFIHGTKVSIISPARESYGLILDSADFAAFQASMFDAMWSLSVPAPTFSHSSHIRAAAVRLTAVKDSRTKSVNFLRHGARPTPLKAPPFHEGLPRGPDPGETNA